MLKPIIIRELEYPDFFRLLYNYKFNKVNCGAVETTLRLMIKKGLISRDHRAICYYGFLSGTQNEIINEKIGEIFPINSQSFQNKCMLSSQALTKKMIENPACLSSYELFTAVEHNLAVSTRMFFQTISKKGEHESINFIGTPSGLNAWENLALELVKYYYMGILDIEHSSWFQEIISRAKCIQIKKLGPCPDISISDYVELVFNSAKEEKNALLERSIFAQEKN